MAFDSYRPRKPVADRLMSKVEFDPNGGCWLWTGADEGRSGYGRFRAKKALGESQAHRASYVLFCGEIPDGMELDHLCRIPACINPKHLEPVTPQENARRAPKPGLARGGKANGERQKAKTHCPRGHEYAVHGFFTKQGWRGCRPCKNVTAAKYRQKSEQNQ